MKIRLPGVVNRLSLWAMLLLAVLTWAPACAARSVEPRPAPSFTLPTRAGVPVDLDSLRGRVVLVDFWASWCEPCKKSFPWLATIYGQYAEKGLSVVAVNLDKNQDQAVEFLDKYSVPFVIAYDPAGRTAEAFDVSVMPTSFLIDRQGRIVLSHPGFDPKKTGPLEDAIKEALKP